jgi:hypothetical protein
MAALVVENKVVQKARKCNFSATESVANYLQKAVTSIKPQGYQHLLDRTKSMIVVNQIFYVNNGFSSESVSRTKFTVSVFLDGRMFKPISTISSWLCEKIKQETRNFVSIFCIFNRRLVI